MYRALLIWVVFACCLSAASSFAQAPDSLSFQGRLTDTNGNPMDSTGVEIAFKLYQSDGADADWSETRIVDVADGVFNVNLGGLVPMGGLAFNKGLKLGIRLVGEGEASEFSPRTPLASAAYARALPGLYTFYTEDANNKGHNVIGGAPNNVVHTDAVGATIGGGGGFYFSGSPDTPAPNSALGDFGTIGGGTANTTSAPFSTVGGGDKNTASGHQSTVAGGGSNEASGNSSAIVGGGGNTASGQAATVVGGTSNHATGWGSFAAGSAARANHGGAFVWQDTTGIGSGIKTLSSTGPNQFLARAAGGVTFLTAIAPNLLTGAYLAGGSGTWASLSSEAAKTRFDEIDPFDYLDRVASLEIREWGYKTEDPAVTHVGPMAEDFYAAFGLGPDERSITTVDADGVALAAIQALHELVREQQAEIDRLKARMNEK